MATRESRSQLIGRCPPWWLIVSSEMVARGGALGDDELFEEPVALVDHRPLVDAGEFVVDARDHGGVSSGVHAGGSNVAHHSTIGGPRCSRTWAMPPSPPERCCVANGPSERPAQPRPVTRSPCRFRPPSPTPCSTSQYASRHSAACRRLVTWPGSSARIAHRRLADRPVRGHRRRRSPRPTVASPPTTSTSGMRCGGLKGWPTRTRSRVAGTALLQLGRHQPGRARGDHRRRARRPRRSRA